jgi:integrase
MPTQPTATLLVVEREGGPVYYAKWREEGWQVKRRLGPAWIERGDAARAGERRRTRHAGWVKRRGRPAEGYLSEDAALARLSQRPMFKRPGDLVFCSRTGEHLDASALRRRYKAARDAAIEENPDMQTLRFHALRHTFGTLAAQGFDLVNVQAMMGHVDSRTTARYLHARPAAEDAAKLTRIFAKDMPSAIVDGDRVFP